jgi:predicted MFS family arabinose efflux permease
MVVGAWLFTRFVGPERRSRVTGPLAVLAGGMLAICAIGLPLWAVITTVFLSGVFASYQIQVGASFGTMTPPDGRAQVMGLLNSAALTAQGIGVLGAGVLAEIIGVAQTVGVAGAFGALIAVAAAVTWSRASQSMPPAAEAPATAA